jgi:prevent-host-death family protein
MLRRSHMTQTMNATQVRQQWSKILSDVYADKTRVVVEKSGIPVAGVVSVRDLRRLRQLDEQQAVDLKLLEDFSDAFKDVPEAELEREVAKAVQEARKDIRREKRLAHSE